MSMRAENFTDPSHGPSVDSIIEEFESGLSRYIGVLSKFIVQRQYGKVMNGGSRMTLEKARMISENILAEAVLLIGDQRGEELRAAYLIILHDHFKEET